MIRWGDVAVLVAGSEGGAGRDGEAGKVPSGAAYRGGGREDRPRWVKAWLRRGVCVRFSTQRRKSGFEDVEAAAPAPLLMADPRRGGGLRSKFFKKEGKTVELPTRDTLRAAAGSQERPTALDLAPGMGTGSASCSVG
ncbi:putative polygalacturonase [Iris pallida]|uniref:Polygalacturonase n=1 Tax=Iris pallida TaxID=29817 RepID=A0AAX6HWI1_IRIPA|nr:putative polygalacturonase [Iris pallida]